MATLTLDQKRLSQIRTQLYGKPSSSKTAKKTSAQETKIKTESVKSLPLTSDSDDHLKKDLTKVATLSVAILALQFVIYYALSSNLININIYGITY